MNGGVLESFSKKTLARANAELVRSSLAHFRTGARITDIVKDTGLSDHIVKRHLTWLCATREVYFEERTGVYFINTRLDHPAADTSFTTESGRAYRLQVMGNGLTGVYVVVQEISKGSDNLPRVQGAISIPLAEASKVLEGLGSTAQQFYNITFSTGEYK